MKPLKTTIARQAFKTSLINALSVPTTGAARTHSMTLPTRFPTLPILPTVCHLGMLRLPAALAFPQVRRMQLRQHLNDSGTTTGAPVPGSSGPSAGSTPTSVVGQTVVTETNTAGSRIVATVSSQCVCTLKLFLMQHMLLQRP